LIDLEIADFKKLHNIVPAVLRNDQVIPKDGHFTHESFDRSGSNGLFPRMEYAGNTDSEKPEALNWESYSRAHHRILPQGCTPRLPLVEALV
jgi:hypothetical protein